MKVDFLLLLPEFPEEDTVSISFPSLVPRVEGGEADMRAIVTGGISETELRVGLGQPPCLGWWGTKPYRRGSLPVLSV